MANMTEAKHNEILDMYVDAVCQHANGEITDEQLSNMKKNVANMLVAQ